jgi:hypothetical protein
MIIPFDLYLQLGMSAQDLEPDRIQYLELEKWEGGSDG